MNNGKKVRIIGEALAARVINRAQFDALVVAVARDIGPRCPAETVERLALRCASIKESN